MIVAGIGCRTGCGPEAIVELVDRAGRLAGVRPSSLAAPTFKAAEPGLREAARRLDLRLMLVEADALRSVQDHTVTRSAAALRATGLASVAEAAAIAAAGPGARLILARIAGAGVTCALARSAA